MDDEPLEPSALLGPGEVATANYGWTKPAVGASPDVWGGELNTDLDGIDATVFAIQNIASNPNRVDNGDMYVDQHNGGASFVVPAAWAIVTDRWWGAVSQVSKLTAGQNYNGLPKAPGFPYFLGAQTTAAATLAAGDLFAFEQILEADAISDFQWGTASAQAVTLSFWACSSQTGTFGGAVGNNAGTRSYVFSYSLPTANTPTKITITIPGDTAGTWVMTGNVPSLILCFDLGSGSSLRKAAGSWGAGGFYGATGAVSPITTLNAKFAITGVKLELGSVATPFVFDPVSVRWARCQRYLKVFDALVLGGYATAGSPVFGSHNYTAMRAAPTVTFSGITYTNASALTLGYAGLQGMYETAVITATGIGSAAATAYLTAEI